MPQLLSLLYLTLFLGAVLTALFIVYHIVRYSLTKKSAVFGVTFFGSVFLVFLFVNAFLFFTVDWTSILENPIVLPSL